MGEVIKIDPDDMSIEEVLEEAKDELTGVVILGYDKEGREYFSTSYENMEKVNWLIDRLKLALMDAEGAGLEL